MTKPTIDELIQVFSRFSGECASMPGVSPQSEAYYKIKNDIRDKALLNLKSKLMAMGVGGMVDFSCLDKKENKEYPVYSVYKYIRQRDLIAFLKEKDYTVKTLRAIERDAKKFSEYPPEALTKQAKKWKLAPHSIKGWEAAKIAVYKHAKIRI